MQVGKVARRSARPLQRLDVGCELDEITGRKACRQPEVTHHLHQQPTGVSARATSVLQRVVGRLHTRLHAHQVTYLALELLIEPHQHRHGCFTRCERRSESGKPCFQARSHRGDFQERYQFLGELRRIRKRIALGVRLDKKVEGIDHCHIGSEIDDDVERLGSLGKHQPRKPVSVRVLLPVQEMIPGFDLERVAEDRRATMRRGPQPDLVR